MILLNFCQFLACTGASVLRTDIIELLGLVKHNGIAHGVGQLQLGAFLGGIGFTSLPSTEIRIEYATLFPFICFFRFL